jgi:predicted nuclease of predicted toxin-antitoxin system
MIRFLVDAQLPPGLARRLVARGYAAEHVNRIGLGVESDRDIWRYAARTQSILITKDEDFVVLAERDANGPQVVWIRIGNIGNEALWQALDPQLDEITQALDAGRRSSRSSERFVSMCGAAAAAPHPGARRAPTLPLQGEGEGYYSVLWLPSQSGSCDERLQAQNQVSSLFSAFHSCGRNSVPLCEPSQNGWAFERPQAHHQ